VAFSTEAAISIVTSNAFIPILPVIQFIERITVFCNLRITRIWCGQDLGEIMADAGDDILGEKTLRYKRNVFVVSSVLIAVQIIPGLNLSSIALLGTTLEGVSTDIEIREFWAWVLALLILGYNAFAYYSYGMTDYGMWYRRALAHSGAGLPHLGFVLQDLGPDFSVKIKSGEHKGVWSFKGKKDDLEGGVVNSEKELHVFYNADTKKDQNWKYHPYEVVKVRPIYYAARKYEFLLPVTAGGIALLICVGNFVANVPTAWKVFNCWLLTF
jgi:hypothetical protein